MTNDLWKDFGVISCSFRELNSEINFVLLFAIVPGSSNHRWSVGCYDEINNKICISPPNFE
jgi:hypothetical protein